ncbi:MAG: acyl-CoA carboxylase epsilon subunit [Acidimicrobiales bacterium]|nr:acyl-CoA carboxylase epsilon subunit [Acidimicrobiales bacterium]
MSPDIVVTRGPAPDSEELAAIVAAVEVATAQPAPASAPPPAPPRWRFSGRWWSKPIPSRRDRPSAF